MDKELALFEKRMARDLESFREHGRVVKKKRPEAQVPHSRGIEVNLCVRKKKYSFLDEEFVTVVNTISELEARLVAERRAREEGWPVIAYVRDMREIT